VTLRDDPPHASNGKAPSPIRELWSDDNYRNFWLAQILFWGVNGTLRFVFIWLIVTLTDWPSAEGLIGIALGLPALLLSLPAGAWSDRVNRQKFIQRWILVTAVLFGVFAVVVASDNATPFMAGVAAVFIGVSTAIISPSTSAIVPTLVPSRLLMNAAALQNGGGQAAQFAGLVLGGAAIALFGNAAGFVLLSVMCVGSAILMGNVDVTFTPSSQPPRVRALVSEMKQGTKYGLSRDPLRTLLVLSLVLGTSFSAMQITIPRLVEEDYGLGSEAAGLLLGTFGVGMLISSTLVAGRREMRHGRNVALFVGIGLGMGQFLLSLAPNYSLSIVVMIAWGINAGIAIASHRTLLQRETSPEMMGRVMGLMTLGFAGGLPFGALTQSLLAPAVGPVMTMRIVGIATMCLTIPLTWRKSFYTR
jgi:MFS family permease